MAASNRVDRKKGKCCSYTKVTGAHGSRVVSVKVFDWGRIIDPKVPDSNLVKGR